jgi:hypothetical protein
MFTEPGKLPPGTQGSRISVPLSPTGAVSTRQLLSAEGSHLTKAASHTGSLNARPVTPTRSLGDVRNGTLTEHSGAGRLAPVLAICETLGIGAWSDLLGCRSSQPPTR